MNFTPSQNEALKDGNNFLVSASAGSGKTAVMVKRIVNTLEKGVKITNLLVVTFTKAAAEEMKDRLLDALYQKIRDPRCVNAAHLKEQITNLPFAYICTIDSFCLGIYRSYFEDISAEPVFNVLDEADAALLFRNTCLEIINERLKECDKAFDLLVEKFTKSRSLDGLIELIINYHKFLNVQENPDQTIKNALNISRLPLDKKPLVLQMFKNIKQEIDSLNYDLKTMLSKKCQNDESGVLAKDYDDELNNAILWTATLLQATSFNKFYSYLNCAECNKVPHKGGNNLQEPFATLRSEVKEKLSCYNNYINGLKKLLNCREGGYFELEALEEKANSILEVFLDTVKCVRERYKRYKQRDGRPDYADLEHYALQILDKKERADEVKESIKYIFLDEYQDINYLQETIITKISNNNVFMVGDVKQSIYGFRFAEPKIFIDKKDSYAKSCKSDYSIGKSVLLNENFRSAEGIINYVNGIFTYIMTDKFGKLAYKDEAMLKKGIAEGFPLDERLKPVYVNFFTEEKSVDDFCLQEFPKVYSVLSGVKVQKKPNEEAVYIADTIEKIVGNVQIYDAKKGEMRLARYSDIAILMRNKKGKEIIEELTSRNIPFAAEGFDSGEKQLVGVKMLLNYLNVIDNYQNDYALYAAMVSYFGGFKEDELALIRKSKPDGFFWEAVDAYANDDGIKAKIDLFFNKTNKFRLLSSYISVDTLINKILSDTGFDMYLLNKESLLEIECVNAFTFSLKGKDIANSLHTFLLYYNNTDIKVKLTPTMDNFVSFYSVHKSKGLEFPIVFLACAEQRLDFSRLGRQEALFDTAMGVALKFKNEEERKDHNTLSYKLMYRLKADAEREELLRLLYVAMTRARYHLFITGKRKEKKDKELILEECSSFLNFIEYAMSKNPMLEGDKSFDDCQINIEKISRPLSTQKESDFTEEEFTYNYQSGGTLFNKYTVSEVNKALISQDSEKHVYRLYGTQSKELGIIYHRFLEQYDYKKRTFEDVKAQLIDFENVNPDLKGKIVLENITSFLNSTIFDDLGEFTTLKEQPFLLYLPAEEVFGGGGKDKILVQGVLDLLIIGKSNILVDFKLSGKSKEEIIAAYKEQLRLYAIAVKKLKNIRIDRRIIYVINQKMALEV